MATSYDKAGRDTAELLDGLVRRRFGELAEAKVTFTILFASNPDGPAVKLHGAAAAAKIAVNGLSKRAEGLADLTITVDAERWRDLTERQRLALLTHEVTHVELVRDDGGHLVTDDCGRPKVRLKPDDWLISGFYSTVEEFRADALEFQSVNGILREFKQRGLFDGEAWG